MGCADMRMDSGEIEMDEVLARRLTRGDDGAFATLAMRHWDGIYRICSNMLAPGSEAREMTRDIFSLALRSNGWLLSGVPFRTSLYRLAMNEVLIKLGSSSEGKADSPAAFNWSGSGASALDGHRLRTILRDALQGAAAVDRAAFVLRVVEGLSLDEVASVLGISRESIVKRCHRVSLMMTGFLGQLFEPYAS
jgi:RNA polymerase sigma-70 factor (ECF subfamily)